MRQNDTETKRIIVNVASCCEHHRLDRWLADTIALSRTHVQRLIREGNVHLRLEDSWKEALDPSQPIHAGQTFCLRLAHEQKRSDHLCATAIPLDIIYEDTDLLVINKPASLVVHPGPGHTDDTLVNALIAYCGDTLSSISGEMKPGIVHRLDKGTSGLIVVAKNDASHQALSLQFHDRSLSRTYQALVVGKPHPTCGEVRTRIGRHPRDRQRMAVIPERPNQPLPSKGRLAISHYELIAFYPAHTISLVRFALKTGRTHQIRVHCSHLRIPIVGDPMYGNTSILRAFPGISWPPERPALHAHTLRFIHPTTHEPLTFESPLPEDMSALLTALSASNPESAR